MRIDPEFKDTESYSIHVFYDHAITKLYNRILQVKKERDKYQYYSHRYRLFFWLTFILLIIQTSCQFL